MYIHTCPLGLLIPWTYQHYLHIALTINPKGWYQPNLSKGNHITKRKEIVWYTEEKRMTRQSGVPMSISLLLTIYQNFLSTPWHCFPLWKIQITSFHSFTIYTKMLVRKTYYYLLINILLFSYYLNTLFMSCILRNMLVKLRMQEMSDWVRLIIHLVQNSVSNWQ